MTIEELGPTFVKFGQILARPSRHGFGTLPRGAQETAIAGRTVRQQHCAGTDRERDERADRRSVRRIRHHPLAAASIGQVYQGRLRSGEEVVLKIQRPFIENKIKLDIYLMKFIARKFAKSYPELAAINIVGLIDEFSETIVKELDYTFEASNILRFAMMFKDDPTVHIPAVYTKYSSRNLIVMEKVEGITPDTPQALRDAGLDTHQIAVNGANALLTMILRHGFFHADPHRATSSSCRATWSHSSTSAW
ncbi:MAG: ABC1 kinase family protein [Alistipes indistinctus]